MDKDKIGKEARGEFRTKTQYPDCMKDYNIIIIKLLINS